MKDMKRYFQFVLPYWKRILLSFIFNIIKLGITLLIPIILKYVIDDVILSKELTQENKLSLFFTIIGITFLIYAIIRPIVDYSRLYFSHSAASKIICDIREKCFDHIQKLSLKFYSNRRTGEIISRVINDVEQTQTIIRSGMIASWIDILSIIVITAIMLTMDITLTLVSLTMFPLYIFSVRFFYKRLKQSTLDKAVSLANVQSHLHERIQGITVTKSFTLEEVEREEFSKQNNDFYDKNVIHYRWNASTTATISTITELAPLLVIGCAGYLVITSELSIGSMVAFLGYVDRLYQPLKRLIEAISRITQSTASMERMFEFLDEEYDIVDKPNSYEIQSVSGDISFKNVSFRYPELEEDVLKNISLEVKAGETVALVGVSGGGKSSLVSLLPRFYDVTGGSIEIDGHNIKDLKVRNLRKHIGIVLQDNILFSGSIKFNIKMGNTNASDKEVIQAAKDAHIHKYIMSLPNGYDTEVGERGVKLSGGQKQRIALARVFLKNPSVLILDEATSALDLESEHFIKQSLDKLSKDRTTFIIAHRLSTITDVDKIILLEKGKIKEIGTHEELMNLRGSYYDLFEVQNLK